MTVSFLTIQLRTISTGFASFWNRGLREAAHSTLRNSNLEKKKGNFSWKYENHYCVSCKLDIRENNEHLLNCKKLLGNNGIISYIPSYEELFENKLDDQVYVSRILRENLQHQEAFKNNILTMTSCVTLS